MITSILTNGLKLWFWTDETNIINTNKVVDPSQPFYAFIYLTFSHLDKKEQLTIEDVSKLPIKNLNMSINIEPFTYEEIKSYFEDVQEDGMINLDTEVKKTSDFVTKFGYGVCDLICGIYYFSNEQGYIYAKPIFDPENILSFVAKLADNISDANPDTLIKTNLYIPNKK